MNVNLQRATDIAAREAYARSLLRQMEGIKPDINNEEREKFLEACRTGWDNGMVQGIVKYNTKETIFPLMEALDRASLLVRDEESLENLELPTWL